MPSPLAGALRVKQAVGAVDGVNVAFTVPGGVYIAGSLAVWLNGLARRYDYDDGWVETDPSIGAFTMKIPPESGDVVFVTFRSA